MTKQLTINIPESITTTVAGHDYTFNVADAIAKAEQPDEYVAWLVTRAFTENVTNAAAGKQGDEAMQARRAKVDSMNKGEVGRAGGGGGKRADDMLRTVRELVRQATKRPVKEVADAVKDRESLIQFANGKLATLHMNKTGTDDLDKAMKATQKKAVAWADEIYAEAQKLVDAAKSDDFALSLDN